MLKELYARIQQLEGDLASFDETAATDEVRFQLYPKKALLAETYYELGQHLEKVQPLESVYCYWKSFVLENDSSIGRRLFGGVKNQLMDDPHDPEEIPSFLEHFPPEGIGFLKVIQHWLGIGEARNYENAFQNLGIRLNAIFMKGMMYKLGYFVKKDNGEAVKWFQLVLAQGKAAAQNDLGGMHTEGRGGLERSDGEAVRAAAQGVAVAQNYLGLMCAEGRGGLDRNDGQAVQLFRLAAWSGETQAQRNLIALYNKEDASIPIGPQEIKDFVRDIRLSPEIKQAVGSYLRKRLSENGENFEVVYCVHRILSPESAMDEILKTVPPLKEAFEFVKTDSSLSDALRINLLYFLYLNGKQSDVRKQAVFEIWRLKLNVSLIETDREGKTPVSKIHLLLDLVATSIVEAQDKPVENICSRILASHYLDEIDNELKKWKSMLPETLSQEERGCFEKSIQEILVHWNHPSIVGLVKAQETARREKGPVSFAQIVGGGEQFLFIQTAAQQFVERFKKMERLFITDFRIKSEQHGTIDPQEDLPAEGGAADKPIPLNNDGIRGLRL